MGEVQESRYSTLRFCNGWRNGRRNVGGQFGDGADEYMLVSKWRKCHVHSTSTKRRMVNRRQSSAPDVLEKGYGWVGSMDKGRIESLMRV